MRGVSNTFVKGVCSNHKQQQELARKWSQMDFLKPVHRDQCNGPTCTLYFKPSFSVCLKELMELIFLILSLLCGSSKTA